MLILLYQLVLVLPYHALLELTFPKLRGPGTRTDLLALERDAFSLRDHPDGWLGLLWVLPLHLTGPLECVLCLWFPATAHLRTN